MKFDKIFIGAFGGLEDFTLDFSDGLNIIYGQNENGKSTVMAFIKMMFYGSGKRSSQIAASPRVKYTPWSGKTMCGSVYFTHGGTRYCLEREFRKSDSTDKITLRNLDMGTSENAESDIGTRFFGLTAAAFEKSNYVGLLSVFSKDETAAGELGSRLSNLALTGDESVSYQEVEGRLALGREALISKNGKKGEYIEGCIRLEALNAELSDSNLAAEKKGELTATAENYKREYLSLSDELNLVKKKLEQEKDIKNAEKLREYLETKSKLDELTATLKTADGKTVDEMFLKTVRFALNRYYMQLKTIETINSEIKRSEELLELSAAGNIEALKDEAEKTKVKISELDKAHAELDENLKRTLEEKSALQVAAASKKNSGTNLLFIAAGLFAVSGVLLTVITESLYPLLFLIAAVLMLASALFYRSGEKKADAKYKNAEAEFFNQEQQLRSSLIKNSEQKADLSERLSVVTTALGTDEALRRQRTEELNARRFDLKTEQQKADENFEELKSHFSRLTEVSSAEEIKNILETLEAKTAEIKAHKQQLNYLARDLENISYEQAAKKLSELEDSSVNASDLIGAKDRAKEIAERQNEITRRTAEILTELKSGFKNIRTPKEIEDEINLLKDDLKFKKDFYDACELASGILLESFGEVRRSYSSDLEKRAIDIFSRLTGGRYSALNVSKSLDMTVEQSGVFGTRELDYLSTGTADQAFLSLRLAIVELISKDEPLPILLDDVLSQFDDTRSDEALAFLKDYCKKTQALLFTCHNSVVDSAKKQEISVTSLR